MTSARSECAKQRYEGKTFQTRTGPCTVTEYVNAKNIRVLFSETGYGAICCGGSLVRGNVRDPTARIIYDNTTEGELRYIPKKYHHRIFKSQYGDFKIIKWETCDTITVQFLSTGYTVKSALTEVLRAAIKDPFYPMIYGVGYLGGSEKSDPVLYDIWRGMLRRCYDPAAAHKSPTYIDCTVAAIWHNFHNFYEWAAPRYREGYHLDKDLTLRGNKEYGPDTCSFIPMPVNVLLTTTKAKRGQYPIGVYCKPTKQGLIRFVAQLQKGTGQQKYLGAYRTPEEAFAVYKAAKEAYIKEVAQAEFDQGNIDERVYNTLMQWEVNIDD